MIWGKTECAHTADGWLVANGKPSAITGSAYDFDTEAGAEALMARRSLPVMVARVMRAAGYKTTKAPEVGDIGVLAFPEKDGTKVVCAVRGKSLWLFRSDTGIGAAGSFARVMCAWSTECHR